MAVSEASGAQDHGEGENYFVSMTDMMVGMLFIFIILLMSFALAFRQQTDAFKDQTEATRATQVSKINHANDIERKLAEIENHIREQINQINQAARLRQKLLLEIKTQLRDEGLIVQVDESNGVLHLTEDTIRFRPGYADLSDVAKQNVGKIASVLARVLPRYVSCPGEPAGTPCQNQTNASVETVFIEGHTDTTGADKDNWDLSARRAANTYLELTSMPPGSGLRQLRNRSTQEILSISGYSSARPIDPANNPAAWEKNRRIDLRFVMNTDVTGGLEQIQGLLGNMRKAIEELKESP